MNSTLDVLTFNPYDNYVSRPVADVAAETAEPLAPSAAPAKPAGRLRSLDIRNTGHPLDPMNIGSIIKPSELIDVVEIASLNRSELVLYNQLLAHAWANIETVKVHRIRKSVLRGSHESNDRLQEAFDRLMGAFAKIRYRHPETGRPMTARINLLGPNTEEDADDGHFYYTFHDNLLRILENSQTWARLKSEIMYLLRSKYALRLYEMVERRINLQSQSECFSVEELRALLGVPEDKLPRFADFNKHALRPALEEINHLTDYVVTVGAIKRGHTVEKLMLTWARKPPEALKIAAAERANSRIGRSARRGARVDVIVG